MGWLARNFDQNPWDAEKFELWVESLLEVRADLRPVYAAREATWAVKYLLKNHGYGRIQLSDFDRAVKEYRFRRKRWEKEQRERLELEALGGVEQRRARLRSIAPLLRLAAPKSV